MNITSIIIRKITPENKMKAIVSITFDDAFVVHDVKVIDGANGLFIAMPSRRIQDGEFKDIVHPINSVFREELSGAVLRKYSEALAHYQESAATAEKRNHENPEEDADISGDIVERSRSVMSDTGRTDTVPTSFVPVYTAQGVAEINV